LIDTQWAFLFSEKILHPVLRLRQKTLRFRSVGTNLNAGILRKNFAVPIKTSSPIPNSVKGYSSGINFDATQQGQSREMALKIMPSTTGVAKSGSVLEPHSTADKKSGSVLEPHSKIKIFIPALYFPPPRDLPSEGVSFKATAKETLPISI
jgi:hypothetical protein